MLMLTRIGVITLNTYREAVRARLLHGLFAVALATAGYSLVVGQFALRSSLRVISDLGAASVSMFGIVVAVVLGATSLYRELELKTIFPILARPVRRTEYVVGKYFGIVVTVFVFIAADSGVLLYAIAIMTDASLTTSLALLGGIFVGALVVAWKVPRARTYVPVLVAIGLALGGAAVTGGAPDERRVVLGAAVLTLGEVAIVAAIAIVFSSFSSPFLTAIFTFGMFVVGRSADTLAHMPARIFGTPIHDAAVGLSKVVPNLMVYAPPRSLLTGEAIGISLTDYLGLAALQSAAWSICLLAFASLLFRRRDFL